MITPKKAQDQDGNVYVSKQPGVVEMYSPSGEHTTTYKLDTATASNVQFSDSGHFMTVLEEDEAGHCYVHYYAFGTAWDDRTRVYMGCHTLPAR